MMFVRMGLAIIFQGSSEFCMLVFSYWVFVLLEVYKIHIS